MPEKDNRREDERDEFPADGIRILDRAGLDEAHRKYNRRIKDEANPKYRQRRTDNVRDEKGRKDSSGGKEIVFGSRKTA